MKEIESTTQLEEHLRCGLALEDVVMQGLDLRPLTQPLCQQDFRGAVLLGCLLDDALQRHAMDSGAMVFPSLEGVPYEAYRPALYRVDELYEAFVAEEPASYQRCLDARVYAHWKQTGGAQASHILDALGRSLHDHAMSDALEELLVGKRVVAIMGGHSMARSRGAYAEVARMARWLCQDGFLLASGGGPGAMEATHVGAWFASRPEEELLEAIDLLAEAPRYDDPRWLSQAFEVRGRWQLEALNRSSYPSLGVPTWLYGHEPPNAFATHIAKYFANSIREEGLLTIAKHGVIFSPGSAGTIQEIFQDACQNHYATVGVVSPMVFFGVDYWMREKPVYPLLTELAQGRDYAEWLSISDDPQAVVAAIRKYAKAQPTAS